MSLSITLANYIYENKKSDLEEYIIEKTYNYLLDGYNETHDTIVALASDIISNIQTDWFVEKFCDVIEEFDEVIPCYGADDLNSSIQALLLKNVDSDKAWEEFEKHLETAFVDGVIWPAYQTYMTDKEQIAV